MQASGLLCVVDNGRAGAPVTSFTVFLVATGLGGRGVFFVGERVIFVGLGTDVVSYIVRGFYMLIRCYVGVAMRVVFIHFK